MIFIRLTFICLFAFLLSQCSSNPSTQKASSKRNIPRGHVFQQKAGEPYKYSFVYGRSLVLHKGKAIAPKSAPEAVQRMTRAGNELQGKPYIYGGGHRSIYERGYDCSGTASYVLVKAGLLDKPRTSGAFMDYGLPGPGKWVTIYAKRGHVFTIVGGLRLDTGYNGQGEGPKWNTRHRPTKGYVMRHPPGL